MKNLIVILLTLTLSTVGLASDLTTKQISHYLHQQANIVEVPPEGLFCEFDRMPMPPVPNDPNVLHCWEDLQEFEQNIYDAILDEAAICTLFCYIWDPPCEDPIEYCCPYYQTLYDNTMIWWLNWYYKCIGLGPVV